MPAPHIMRGKSKRGRLRKCVEAGSFKSAALLFVNNKFSIRNLT